MARRISLPATTGTAVVLDDGAHRRGKRVHERAVQGDAEHRRLRQSVGRHEPLDPQVHAARRGPRQDVDLAGLPHPSPPPEDRSARRPQRRRHVRQVGVDPVPPVSEARLSGGHVEQVAGHARWKPRQMERLRAARDAHVERGVADVRHEHRHGASGVDASRPWERAQEPRWRVRVRGIEPHDPRDLRGDLLSLGAVEPRAAVAKCAKKTLRLLGQQLGDPCLGQIRDQRPDVGAVLPCSEDCDQRRLRSARPGGEPLHLTRVVIRVAHARERDPVEDAPAVPCISETRRCDPRDTRERSRECEGAHSPAGTQGLESRRRQLRDDEHERR